MSVLPIAVVEEQAEEEPIPVLPSHLIRHFCPKRIPDAPRPVRQNRSPLPEQGVPEERIGAAARKTNQRGCGRVVLDAGDDFAGRMAPELLGRARNASRGSPIAAVAANRENEAWLIAGAATLAVPVRFPPAMPAQPNFEQMRGAKRRLGRWRAGLASRNSSSFDKLCRELSARFGAT